MCSDLAYKLLNWLAQKNSEIFFSIHLQCIITKIFLSYNLVNPPNLVTCNSQFAKMYRYVLGFFSMTVERIGAENAVKDSFGVHPQRSFSN